MQIIDNQHSIIVIYLTLLNIYFSKSAYAGKATPVHRRTRACMYVCVCCAWLLGGGGGGGVKFLYVHFLNYINIICF